MSLNQSQQGFNEKSNAEKLQKPLAWTVMGAFAFAVRSIIAIGTFGARKHSPDGWRSNPVKFGLKEALEAHDRHMNAFACGEVFDPEHGQSHLMSAAWNLMAAEEHRRHAAGEPSSVTLHLFGSPLRPAADNVGKYPLNVDPSYANDDAIWKPNRNLPVARAGLLNRDIPLSRAGGVALSSGPVNYAAERSASQMASGVPGDDFFDKSPEH